MLVSSRCQTSGSCYSLLYKITRIIMEADEMDDMLDRILVLLSSECNMRKGLITILNTEKNQIFIEKAFGFTKEQVARGKYLPGEGIIGKVVETGKPAVVPDVTDEPQYLNRTNSLNKNDKLSLICVPIKHERETVGTLSIFGEESTMDELNEDVKSLSVIAFMISEAVRIIKLEREKEHEVILELIEENNRLKNQIEDKKKFRPENMIGSSKEITDVFSLVERVAKTNTSVLILGESGVGKELIAQAIHYNSTRADKNFIKMNCAALPPNLIESELFGHEKGAFTGAIATRKGRFEIADGGTIFLDEITEIPLSIQVKLLRVLQEREIERVGATLPKKIDVRIIAATNKDIPELIKNGEFREDLYYRLNVFPINIPALRSRRSDILLLSDFFAEKYAKLNNKVIRRISTPAIDMLVSYHWPGNVRELENCIERAVVLSTDGVIHSYHLPPSIQTADATNTGYRGTLQQRLDAVEYEMIVDTLKTTSGNMSEAAKLLGITERMIGIRMDKYKINYKIFRELKNE